MRSGVCAAVLFLVAIAPASARSSANDVAITVGIGTLGAIELNKTTAGSDFPFSVIVSGGAAAPVTVTVTLPDGLHWLTQPSAAEGCTGANAVVCASTLQTTPGGTYAFWSWRIHADRAGSYAITASVTTPESDPDLSNNTATFTVQIQQPSSSGGGSAAAAGAAKLTPAKPRAGNAFVASVRVEKDGTPVLPRAVACSASVGSTKVTGTARATSGLASCRFTPPRGAKGKQLRGTVSFAASGAHFSRSFRTRLS